MLLDNLKAYVVSQGIPWQDFVDTNKDEILRFLTDGDTAGLVARTVAAYPALSVTGPATSDATTVNNAVSGNTFQSTVLSTAFSTTSNVRSTVATIPVVAGGTYRIQLVGTFQTSIITNGASIGLGTSGAAGTVQGYASMAASAAVTATEVNVAFTSLTSSITTGSVSAANTPHWLAMDVVFVCTTGGSVLVQFGSELALNAAQLNAGTAIIWTQLS